MDQICDESCRDDTWIERLVINDALQTLNDREKNIINKRFYEGRTQMEIAAEIGISQAQVSRLEKNALEKIKKQI
jgi:RNA polymerase sporulation-specific sigma factor